MDFVSESSLWVFLSLSTPVSSKSPKGCILRMIGDSKLLLGELMIVNVVLHWTMTHLGYIGYKLGEIMDV